MSVRSTDLTSEERAKELRLAWRGLVASLIAVKPHLDKPYPDDARWTPWSRFIEHAIHTVDAALRAAESERAALEESLSCRSDWHPDEIQKVVEECAKWERYAKQMDSERAELAREVEELREALRRLANPTSVPKSEDAALLQIEVQEIARAALSEHERAEKWLRESQMNLTNYGIASERAERAEAEVYREHQAVEGWSLRAERAEARVAELEAALVNRERCTSRSDASGVSALSNPASRDSDA